MSDKRCTEDEDVVAELRDGMTIGIGGWAPGASPCRRAGHPALAAQGPDRRVVRRARRRAAVRRRQGPQARIRLRLARLDPLEPHFRAARQAGAIASVELDEGMLQWGLYAASLRLPFLPTPRRSRLECCASIPACAPSPRPTTTPRSWWPCRPSRSTRRSSTSTGPTARQRPVPRPRPLLRRPLPRRGRRGGASSLRADRRHRRAAGRAGTFHTPDASTGSMVDGVMETPGGAHFTSCEPGLRAGRGVPEELRDGGGRAPSRGPRSPGGSWTGSEADYQAAVTSG